MRVASRDESPVAAPAAPYSLPHERRPDHSIEQTRTDDRVPAVELLARFARVHFVEIEADDALPGTRELLEPQHRFAPRQSPRHRGSGVRTQRRIEAVDVERDVD